MAEPNCHTQQADDEQRPSLVSQPVGTGNAKEAENRVDNAGVLEQGAPQNGDGHRAAQNGRNVVNGTEQVDELDLEVQDVGDEQREHQLKGTVMKAYFTVVSKTETVLRLVKIST